MILLTLIVLVLALIVFFKTKKIKDLNKNLLKRETMFVVLYEQRFEALLKVINATTQNIQDSIFMDIAELRKDSIFIKKNEKDKNYLSLEEKIQSILKKIKKSDNFSKISTQPSLIEIENHMNKINDLIEETKSDYNNLIDHFNQETTDFFGKKISKYMKGLKTFKHI